MNTLYDIPLQKFTWKFGLGSYYEYFDDLKYQHNQRPKWLPYFAKQNNYNFTMVQAMFRVSREIAKMSLLGLGNTIIGFSDSKNRKTNCVLFYKGVHVTDCPIIVAEYQSKYAIFKHPNFESYGRVLVCN